MTRTEIIALRFLHGQFEILEEQANSSADIENGIAQGHPEGTTQNLAARTSASDYRGRSAAYRMAGAALYKVIGAAEQDDTDNRKKGQ